MTELKQATLSPMASSGTEKSAAVFDIEEAAGIAKLLHNVYFAYPSADFINLLAQNEISKTWHMFANNEDYHLGVSYLSRYLDSWNDEKLTELMLDYGDLYFGASMPLALPWGSCWLTEQRLLNDTSTHELLRFYGDHGIELQLDKNQPADHIGIFLSVISQLLTLMSDPTKESQHIESKQVLTLLLSNHLLTWSAPFLQASIDNAKTDFYRAMALLLRELLNALTTELNILSAVHVKSRH
ncbi:Cytoplasmic chaperone TorD [Shewanella piezotolerans WP3]|uniref:Cytoplasmic chaperone TorD n=1 Tax=Shewanella piezotolerans (strain WP3 / JCM 13877) TaxID=225849 RepID=B8CIR6_SHEPW|nr:molecular chaperone TorD family protein [Shewanella piezotolerans]ACJ27542.1 Cytoplasmic chaperone TorD [Shewanella piezotolerans WP3]